MNGALVLNDPKPNYQQELAKCQRYFVRILKNNNTGFPLAYGICRTATEARMTIPLPTPMRNPNSATVTISDLGAFKINSAGVDNIPTAYAFCGFVSNTIGISFTTTGLTQYSTCTLMFYTLGEYIDISTDL